MTRLDNVKAYLQAIGCGGLFSDAEVSKAVTSLPFGQVEDPGKFTFTRAIRVYFSSQSCSTTGRSREAEKKA